MARPNWSYIRVDVLMPTNPKVTQLPLPARWLLIELWCYCGQHLTDGFVPDKIWQSAGRSRDRKPLLDHGFAERVEGGYFMHDYLDHQRSREEADSLHEKRRRAGERGGRAKAAGLANALASASAPQLDITTVASPTEAKPKPNQSQNQSQNDATTDARTTPEHDPVDNASQQVSHGDGLASGLASAKQTPQHLLSKRSSKHLAEAEAEVLKADVVNQSADRRSQNAATAKPHDDDQTGLIIKEVLAATGRHITPEWGRRVRAHILDGREPSDAGAYIRAAIRNEPNPRLRFLEQY